MTLSWPPGLGRIILDQVDSTNAEAQRLAEAGKSDTWILARQQTSGKGSRGRHWETGTANFAASLLTRPDAAPAQAALRSFTAGLAVADTMRDLGVPEAAISLKWPNDVLLEGQKCAGILLESSGGGDRIAFLVIGIGINLTSAPPRSALASRALPATCLADHLPTAPDPEKVLDHLAHHMKRYEDMLERNGFTGIRDAWLGMAARHGQEIEVQQGDTRLRGRFETLDESGALLLTTPTGQQAISAGEIFFPSKL